MQKSVLSSSLNIARTFKVSLTYCHNNNYNTLLTYSVYVVVQFYPWFNFYFPLFWGMVMYDNEFKTMGNKN